MPRRPEPGPQKLSVGIATRNRPNSLARCLASLAIISDLITDIVVVDDASDIPIQSALDTIPTELRARLTLLTQEVRNGPIVGRNTMVKRAQSPIVLMLDDDTLIVDDRGLRRALELIVGHPNVGAVACAMAHEDGSPWPAETQPSPVRYLAYVPAYIGFAHLLRRDLFLQLGSYRALFYFYGEEKDYCIRLLNAGYHVVYDPEALVAHLVDPAGRSPARYLRYVIRNDCLHSLCNEPFPLPLISLPLRLYRYEKMRRHGRVEDPGGLRWIVSELGRALPAIARERKAVRWSSMKRWRELRRTCPAFNPQIA
jgi:GT2 family glycosyltransferase